MPDKIDNILYEVRGDIAIITINLPKQYNALDFYDYQKLEEYLRKADAEPDTIITIVQSTGKFFSAGANVAAVPNAVPDESLSDEERYNILRREYSASFAARNQTITYTLNELKKVLVVALNGPVIGLSASLVAFADFIYAKDEEAYFLTPFANIGLVSEGAAALTLVERWGWSIASEALLSAKPVSAKRLYDVGFYNELYSKGQFESTEKFNQHVYETVVKKFDDLVPNSVLAIKQLMKRTTRSAVNDVNSEEVIKGLDLFSKFIPQQRFAQLAQKSRRHKL